MKIYDFLKINDSYVDFDVQTGTVLFPDGKVGCHVRSKEEFLTFYEGVIREYMGQHNLTFFYAVLYIGRKEGEWGDKIQFYTNWRNCEQETHGRPHLLRKCEDIEDYLTNFFNKDFTIERIEQSWTFSDKKTKPSAPITQNTALEMIGQAAMEDIINASVTSKGEPVKLYEPPKPEPEKISDKERIFREYCKAHNVDPEEIPPWKTPEEFVKERDKAKKQKDLSVAYKPLDKQMSARVNKDSYEKFKTICKKKGLSIGAALNVLLDQFSEANESYLITDPMGNVNDFFSNI